MICHPLSTILFSIFIIMFLSFKRQDDRIIMYSYFNDSKETGYITLKKEGDKICDIEVSISDIDSVESLNVQKYVYVVWIENLDGKIFNIGKMIGNPGKRTYHLFAHINTLCILKPVRISVTEESNENVTFQSNLMIASTKKF
jgi:hypothetical protein